MMKVYQTAAKWTLPSKIDENSNVWMISVNGFTIDARYAPVEIQKEVYRRGLIPYLPGNKTEEKDNNIIKFKTKLMRVMKQLVQDCESDQSVHTNNDEAEELIYQACEADDEKEAIELALKALELWPDCADAYFILADEADDIYGKGIV